MIRAEAGAQRISSTNEKGKTMFRKTIRAGMAAAALAPALAFGQTPAAAPAPTPEHTLTGNVGFFSQYIFRGLTQTDREPALQGGFDYAHSSGLYAGTWASNISWLRDQTTPAYSRGGSLEWDFYGGYKGTFGKSDFSYDLGTLYYWYPGTANPAAGIPAAPAAKADTWEVYAGVGWKWFTAKYSYSLMNKTFAVRDSRGTWYLDLTATVPFGEFFKPLDGLSLIAHWGAQEYRGTDPRNVGGISNDNQCSLHRLEAGIVLRPAAKLHRGRVLHRHEWRKQSRLRHSRRRRRRHFPAQHLQIHRHRFCPENLLKNATARRLAPAVKQGATMKLVTAIIKPFKLDEVREALSAIGVTGITVTEVRDSTAERTHRALPGRGVRGRLPAQSQNRSRHQDRAARAGH